MNGLGSGPPSPGPMGMVPVWVLVCDGGCSTCGAVTVVYVWFTNWGTSDAGTDEAPPDVDDADAERFFRYAQTTIPAPAIATHAHIGNGPSLFVNTLPRAARSGSAMA